MKQYKNTVNTSTHITKTPTHIHKPIHYKTHLYNKTHTHQHTQVHAKLTDIAVKISEFLKVNMFYQQLLSHEMF